MILKLKKIKDVPTPSYAHPGDAGLDLYAAEDCVLQPLERKLVPTGIQIAVPTGFEAQVRPRSGLALKKGLSIVNTPGTIDAGYRGEVGVICINLGKESIAIKKSDKIAQMVINKVEHAIIEETDNLDETSRGSGGFGSTGT
ncbi:dUTP diphosphatase [Candidatus Woesearchaeota archaeon]|nr:dUTP diphosphatase [Candidatus Woesearchaeota archaeon]